MKHLFLKTISILLILFVAHSNAIAWNSSGHMIIASIAYNQLTDENKEKLTELLKYHPDFAKWNSIYNRDDIKVDKGEYLFMRASIWPDEIRGSGNAFNNPKWHGVNYKIRFNGEHSTERPDPDDDVLFAIDESIEVLVDDHKVANISYQRRNKENIRDLVRKRGAVGETKAAHLSWLIHLMGDIHQPLHCGSLYSRKFPNGDHAGSKFWVKPNTRGVNLHSYWDGLMGESTDPQKVHNNAVELINDLPRSKFDEISGKTDAELFCFESFNLAIEEVYKNGSLRGSENKNTAPELPNGYNRNAKKIGKERVVVSGYRLADTLNAITD